MTLFVIIGVTGDLAERKLLPALAAIARDMKDPPVVLGVSSRNWNDIGFRQRARSILDEGPAEWIDQAFYFEQVDRDGTYDQLGARITEIEARHGLPGNRVFYLALPPQVFGSVIDRLGAANLNAGAGWTRLVVEKPFGSDLESAVALNRLTHQHFDESQVYRIDHYLGKDSVQNLLVFRFTNPLFEASWNRDRVDRVEITVAETVDVDDRAGYYDRSGAVRDMLQNHLTQVLTLIAMESPVAMDADAIRAEKVKVLRAIAPMDPGAVVLGQYTAGQVEGRSVPNYIDHEGVADDSKTPTFAAARLHIDNWRWQGVPFYVRTGKAMSKRVTQIAVTFQRPPVCFFHSVPDECIAHSDVLYLKLQPDEGFELEIEVKEPGDSTRLRTIPLRFDYAEAFGDIPEAYETLIRDVLEGDQTLFVRSDEVEEAWRVYMPVLNADLPVHEYRAGSWGPGQSRDLLGEAPNWATGPS